MSIGFKLLKTLTVVLFLTSCSLERNWRYDQSLGLGPTERLIWVPYDASAVSVGSFPLYYFTKEPFDSNKPTVLFCAGGPGQLVRTTGGFIDSLAAQYNVVYFHVRGSGFSQFPPSNSHDEYLRTRFVVEDIEQIRSSLKIDRWEAIVGHSYGTVVAQQYAGTYGKNGSKKTDRVNKLILIAPLSRQKIESAADASQLSKKITDKHREVLEKIYSAKLNDQSGHQRAILAETEKIFDEVESNFGGGGMQFVIDEFSQLKGGHPDLLKERHLDHSHALFKALRNLRFIGWLNDPNLALEQENTALLIAQELACKMEPTPSWEPEIEIEEGVKYVLSYCDTLDAIRKLSIDTRPGEAGLGFSREDGDKWAQVLKQKRLETLKNIYESEDRDLNQVQGILDKVSRILDGVQREFGGLPYVIMKYDNLTRASPPQKPKSDLEKNALNYPPELFKALYRLSYVDDTSPKVDSRTIGEKRVIGAIVADAIAKTRPGVTGLENRHRETSEKEIALINNLVETEGAPKWAEEMKAIRLANIKEIYAHGFNDLEGYQEQILKETERILNHVADHFGGCLDCIIKNHKELSNELTKYGLDDFQPGLFQALQSSLYINEPPPRDEAYTVSLFEALRRLRSIKRPLQEDAETRKQQRVGATIGRAIACGLAAKIQKLKTDEFLDLIPAVKGKEKSLSYCDAVEAVAGRASDSAQRVYNVVSAYDGLNLGFLEMWLAGDKADQMDVKRALRESAGSVHNERCDRSWSWRRCRYETNQEIENIGITAMDLPKPWKPANFRHWVPTLILEGKADPVVAGDQADQIFTEALDGPRVHIKFPGIGHNMELPQILIDRSIESSGPCAGEPIFDNASKTMNFFHRTVRDCLIDSFLREGIDEETVVLKELKKEFRNNLKEMDRIERQYGQEKPYDKAEKN